MTPFAQLRLWLREGPAAEHQLGVVALLVVVALAAWVVVPIDRGHGTGTLAATSPGSGQTAPSAGTAAGSNQPSAPNATTAAGPSAAGSSTATGGASAAAGGTGTATGSGTSAGTPGTNPATPTSGSACAPAAPGVQGVSNSQITLGVDLVDIGALGSVIGLPSYGDQVKAFTAVFDSYNRSGGVQCRKLVPKFYRDNVTDTNSEQAVCLQMQQDKVFAALNNLYNAQTITCIAQAHIPNVWYTPPHLTQLQKYYPYILSIQPNYDRLIKDYIFGANQRGWFGGVTKIGILEQTCYPEMNSDIARALSAISIPSNKVETFNFGCTSATTSDPFQEAQAVRQFSSDHVTHVLNVAYQQVIAFTTAAKNANYHPKYAIMQDAEMNLMQASQMPPDPSFDGALGITTDQIGATYTPNVPLSPSTAACAKILASVGLGPPTAGGTTGALFGNACSTTALLVAALRHETQIAGDKLAAAVGTVGGLDFPYQTGPANFTDPNDPTGGQMWRPVTYSAPCTCFHVLNAAWQKGFA